ncbi:nucleotide-sugar transporter-domain-containing protein [Glomus cerebriforme]|uniref:Nucleotide-sugar transporter-domain-containing protein n=1 Tax=Glomus cerebriforme TaxID=658196 RepID=A0A397TB61_9GLOM|nr:nucleotide-sugar transporter-domain-containing protein [Glomus cerebriforme]
MMRNSSTILLSFLLCVFNASESLLVGIANLKQETKPNSTKIIFLVELVKIIISMILFSVELGCFSGGISHETTTLSFSQYRKSNSIINFAPLIRSLKSVFTDSTTLLFGIPAMAYFINNNLIFLILNLMNPPTFTVLSNLKILTTGLFSYIFLNRILSTTQWISLILLFIGTTVAQIQFSSEGAYEFTSSFGLLLIFLFASISAGASVYTEYVMKDKFGNESIHLQNIKLYLFGVLLNGLVYFTLSYQSDDGFFLTLYPIHYAIVISVCSLGLITSAIIKYSGSITKVYANSLAMFFSGFVCYFALEFSPTINFFLGALICCLSIHMYSTGGLDQNNFIKSKELESDYLGLTNNDLEENVRFEKKNIL